MKQVKETVTIFWVAVITAAAFIAWMIGAQMAAAQNANSESEADAYSASGALAASALTVNNYSSGKTEVKTAPPVSAPSVFGGGHPCLAGQSGGLSIMGGGASYGQSNAEPACMAWMMGNPEVAIAIMMENEKFRRAVCKVGYYRLGNTTAPVNCNSTLPAKKTASGKPALSVKCAKRSDGAIVPQVSRAVAEAYTSAQIKAACK